MRFMVIAASLAVLLNGCAAPAPPSSLLAAAKPRAKVPAVRAGNFSAGTVAFRPVGPSGWEEPKPEAVPPAKGTKP